MSNITRADTNRLAIFCRRFVPPAVARVPSNSSVIKENREPIFDGDLILGCSNGMSLFSRKLQISFVLGKKIDVSFKQTSLAQHN